MSKIHKKVQQYGKKKKVVNLSMQIRFPSEPLVHTTVCTVAVWHRAAAAVEAAAAAVEAAAAAAAAAPHTN